MRRIILMFAAALVPCAAATADDPKYITGRPLLAELQKGGYVLFMRHPSTNQDQADTDTANLDNLKAQRHLTDEGRAQAKALGEAFRTLKIPVAGVLTSKYYRAIEAGKLTALADVTTAIELTESQNVSPNEAKKRGVGLKKLLSTPPADGKNLLLVSHKPNLQEAAGKEFGDLSEGEIAVFKPLGEKGFQCIARVKIGSWSDWAR